MTERAEDLKRRISDQKTDFLTLLQDMVCIETPTSGPDLFNPLFEILIREFEKLGYSAEHIKGQSSAGQLLFTPAGYKPERGIQLLIGHCDTVWKTGTLQEMPFLIKDNEVSGPGVYDMKAGVAMMIHALRASSDTGKSFPLQPVILLNTDEETGSRDSEDLIEQYARIAKRTFVLEPSLGPEGLIKTTRKGVGKFEILVKGVPSHAGLAPDEGVSAILGLSHIVQQLFRLNNPSKGITVNVGTIEGGERANVIAARSKAILDVRVPTKEDGEWITEQIYGLKPEIAGVEVEISGAIDRPPMEKTEGTVRLWKHLLQLGSELKLDLNEGCSGGASDGNLTNQFSPTLDGLGAVGEGAHAYHEKIFLKETMDRIALLSLLLISDPDRPEGKGSLKPERHAIPE